MKRDGEAVRFVANALDQQQRRIVRGERDRILVLARVEQLFLLRDADRHQVRQAEFLERGVGRRQLALAAVDQHEIGKRPAVLEQLAIAPQHDLVHRREVVVNGPALGAGTAVAARLPPLIRNFRYSPRRMRPSSHTTIDATVSLP